MSFSSIKSFLHKGNRATWCVFVLFALMLFIKCVLFHWDAYHSILISSLWKDPLSFYKFYMAKLLMPLFIASFVLITKRYWWTIIVSFLVDIWCISNLIYFKTYDAFLTVNDILLVGNMDGAWSSVTAYFDWTMIGLVILTILWSMVIILLHHCNNERHWRIFILTLLLINAFAVLNNYFIYNEKFATDQEEIAATKKWLIMTNALDERTQFEDIPFYSIYLMSSIGDICGSNAWCEGYIRQQSVISFFVANLIYYLAYPNMAGDIISLEPQDISKISRFIQKNPSNANTPNISLIIILVESLESWPLEHDIEGISITPSLRKLIKQNHILYCDKIISQTRGGNSGDGQMIVNTGLLPTQNGVACMNYGDNIYPNIAHTFTTTTIINPWPHIWNQDTMSIRYHYDNVIEPHSRWDDCHVMDTTFIVTQAANRPYCTLAITLSTHSPFTAKRNRFTASAPSLLNLYMQCLNYTDSCIGAFMGAVLTDSVLSQSTIVITGDHTIFKPAMLPEFKDYATQQNLSIASGDNFCPLIIYSPSIQGNIQITDTCYQMDIYPTIMHLIGCEDSYWKGFGVNLLDSTARHNRPITEQEAYRLSDLMIRSDYFRRYMQP